MAVMKKIGSINPTDGTESQTATFVVPDEDSTNETDITEDTMEEENTETEDTVDSHEDNVKFDADVSEKSVPAAERNVKVKLHSNHNCTIGGVSYSFAKDKVYNVPENVKRILEIGGMLKPL